MKNLPLREIQIPALSQIVAEEGVEEVEEGEKEQLEEAQVGKLIKYNR